jgi:hypothetical protein
VHVVAEGVSIDLGASRGSAESVALGGTELAEVRISGMTSGVGRMLVVVVGSATTMGLQHVAWQFPAAAGSQCSWNRVCRLPTTVEPPAHVAPD